MKPESLQTHRRVATLPTEGISAVDPVAGLYRARLGKGSVYSAIKLWFGAPLEPWTLEEMDRADNWNALANGRWIDFYRVWPSCTAEPIDQAEYDHLIATHQWGCDNAPDSPQANPFKKVDLLSAPLPF